MNQIPTMINLADWELFGGGYTANSYYHKKDKTIMLKLYAEFMRPEEGLHELEITEKILNLGIPCTKPIQYVTTGKQFGAIFERLQNKKSFARIVADEPSNAIEFGKLFAKEAKKLHSVTCDTSFFPSASERYIKLINENTSLKKEQKERALDFVKNVPYKNTCLHGDFHLGNILIANKKIYFIDLGDFAYGNPLFDLGTFYFVTHYTSDDSIKNMFHSDKKIVLIFYKAFMEEYFENKSINEIDKIVKPFAGLTALLFGYKTGRFNASLKSAFEDNF